MVANTDMRSMAHRAHNNDAFEYAARAGYAIAGAIHLLVAYIILQIALGSGGTADQSGAIGTIASKPFGAALLWIAAAGLLALALWQLAESVIGPRYGDPSQEDGKKQATKRIKAFALAVLYAAMAFTAIKYAMGSGEPQTERNTELSARLMTSGAGKALLIAVGLGIIAVGGYHVYKGYKKRFMKHLNATGHRWVQPVGMTGYIAKGVVLGGAGILVIVATLTADPAKASGIDAAIKTLGAAPFGKVLLILAALGIAAYGVFDGIRSRYAQM